MLSDGKRVPVCETHDDANDAADEEEARPHDLATGCILSSLRTIADRCPDPLAKACSESERDEQQKNRRA
jgi:hypothetical protein